MSLRRPSGHSLRVAALLLAVAAAHTWLVHDMHWLPSGLFGGDYAYQLSCVRGIVASHNPMSSCSVAGALPGYFPLYGTLVAAIALLGRLDALQAMWIAAVVLRVLSSYVVYRAFARLFGRSTGLVIACLWTTLHPEMIFKYTEFATGVMVPLYFLALHRYLDRPGNGRALALGLALAALGYTHSVAFIGGVAIAGLAIVAGLPARSGWRGIGGEIAAALPHLGIFVATGALALGYWYRPLFVHHGRTSLHYAEWTSFDMSTLEARLGWARRTLLTEFSFDSVPLAILTCLIVGGAAWVAFGRERRRFMPAAISGGASFLWMFHAFATVPLLHTHFIPLYVQWVLWGVGRMFLAAIPVAALFARVQVQRRAGWIESVALALTLVGVVAQARATRVAPGMDLARAPQEPAYEALGEYARGHLDPNAVALSTNEMSFAWSALTGRKIMVTRRGQNDAFIDMDVRNRDAALILYGHDDSLRTRLLDQYRVDYLFWSVDWFHSEYREVASGDTVASDPLFYFRNDAYDDQLLAAGVRFFHDFTWVDPWLRGDDFPRFDLTIVVPQNYERGNQPWRDDLNRRLEPVWFYPKDGPKVVALFRVKRRSDN